MFSFRKKTKEMIWSINLIKNDNNDWYINYMQNKLFNQINKLKLQDKINIIILNNIDEFDVKNCGDYINMIEDGDISDNYIEMIYKNIKNGKNDCVGLSGIVHIDDKSIIFNQISDEYPISKMNPIKKNIIKNIDKYWELELSKIIKSKIDIKDLIIFKEKIETKKLPISIIITAYQTQDFIEECLDSIENQTYFKNNNEFEILIGVDFCYDTLNKLNEIKDKYRNLQVYMMPENKGTYITTNTLIDLVKNENVIRFDSDDIMELNLVEDIIKNKKDNDIIKIGYVEMKDNIILNNKIIVESGIIYFKKSIMDNIASGYMPWVCAADTELISRLKNKVKISEINKKLFLRRIHENSLTNKISTGYNSSIRKNYANQIKNYYDEDEIKIERIVNIIGDNIGKKNISDFYSLVIPTMWCSDKIFRMLPIYDKSEYIKEIIIIDNDFSKKPDLSLYY